MIRKSTVNDREIIQQLLEICFGDRTDYEPYNNLCGRYYLNFKNGNLVALTGLTSDSEFKCLEVDWTCTHPDYRNNGCMQELFTEMLNGVDEPVYCSCWRLADKDKVNLHTLMDMFGFEEVVHSRVHWKVPHNCFRNYKGGCAYCTGDGCECYEDLFLRNGNKCK